LEDGCGATTCVAGEGGGKVESSRKGEDEEEVAAASDEANVAVDIADKASLSVWLAVAKLEGLNETTGRRGEPTEKGRATRGRAEVTPASRARAGHQDDETHVGGGLRGLATTARSLFRLADHVEAWMAAADGGRRMRKEPAAKS